MAEQGSKCGHQSLRVLTGHWGDPGLMLMLRATHPPPTHSKSPPGNAESLQARTGPSQRNTLHWCLRNKKSMEEPPSIMLLCLCLWALKEGHPSSYFLPFFLKSFTQHYVSETKASIMTGKSNAAY